MEYSHYSLPLRLSKMLPIVTAWIKRMSIFSQAQEDQHKEPKDPSTRAAEKDIIATTATIQQREVQWRLHHVKLPPRMSFHSDFLSNSARLSTKIFGRSSKNGLWNVQIDWNNSTPLSSPALPHLSISAKSRRFSPVCSKNA